MAELDRSLEMTFSGPRRVRSIDALLRHRDDAGAVVGSRRLGPDAPATDLVQRTAPVAALLEHWSADSSTGMQSGLLTVRERAATAHAGLCIRLESVAGPVLLSAASTTPDSLTRTPAFATPPALPDRLGTLSAAADERPLRLSPAVAATVVAGAGFSLMSAGGRAARWRMAGRRILPGLTLTLTSSFPPPPNVDDTGAPTADIDLVQDGRGTPPAPGTRLRWSHDRQTLVEAEATGWRLSGPAGPAPGTAVLDLVHCLEGLQRYHTDGTVRLRCLAHDTTEDAWSVLTVTATPLRLLRRATYLDGAAATVWTDAEVTTPALVLPSPRALREGGNHDVVIEQL